MIERIEETGTRLVLLGRATAMAETLRDRLPAVPPPAGDAPSQGAGGRVRRVGPEEWEVELTDPNPAAEAEWTTPGGTRAFDMTGSRVAFRLTGRDWARVLSGPVRLDLTALTGSGRILRTRFETVSADLEFPVEGGVILSVPVDRARGVESALRNADTLE